MNHPIRVRDLFEPPDQVRKGDFVLKLTRGITMNHPDLLKLTDQMPTHAWRERINDPYFNEENISATEAALVAFLNGLLSTAGSPDAILEKVKDLIITLNHLGGINGTMGTFIETLEREELYKFIDRAARAAGLEIEKGKDITEEWREW